MDPASSFDARKDRFQARVRCALAFLQLRPWPRFGSAAPDLLSVPYGTLLVLLALPLATARVPVNHCRDRLWCKGVALRIEGNRRRLVRSRRIEWRDHFVSWRS